MLRKIKKKASTKKQDKQQKPWTEQDSKNDKTQAYIFLFNPYVHAFYICPDFCF